MQSQQKHILDDAASDGWDNPLLAAVAQACHETGRMLTDDYELHVEALPYLQKAVSLQPDHAPSIEALARACVRRAASLKREGKFVEAENLARKALALNPDLNDAQQLLTQMPKSPFEGEDKLDILLNEAAALHQSSSIEPLAMNLYQQAIWLHNSSRFAEAESKFRQARALHKLPEFESVFAFTLANKGIEALNAIKFPEAETAFWEALALQPDNNDIAGLLTHIAKQPGRYVHNIWDPQYAASASELRQALAVRDVTNADYVRKGGTADGAYVMVDSGLNNTVVYSLGIGNNISWDMDMAALGCQIYQYDHTIDGLPVSHENFHWSKIGIAGTRTADPSFRTLDELIEENGHAGRKDLILKTDIETAEWEMFAEMTDETLLQFSQIVGEFHRLSRIVDTDSRDTMMAVFGKLNKHFQLVHAHANNFVGMAIIGGVPIYHCMELTFLRRDNYSFAPTTRILPTPLDQPCIPKLADLYLGQFGG